MKNSRFTTLVTLLTLCCSLSICAQTLQMGPDGYGKTILSNGITVLVNEDKTTSLTAGRILIGGGLLTETAADNGITNLMVNMLLKGNALMKADEISSRLDYLGVSVSANCYRDFADITFTCLTENFAPALDIIAASMTSPTFPPEELVKLKTEVEGRIKAANDDQSTASSMLFWKTAFGTEGYGLPVLGTMESYVRPTVDDIKKHYAKLVGGSNLIISIATDMPATGLLLILQRHFGKIKPSVELPPTPSLKLQAEKTGFISFDRNQSYIFKGFVLDRLSPREFACLNLLNQVMGAGVGSRLWGLRQKEKLAYDVYSQWIAGKHNCFFRSAIGTDTSKVGQALASLDREWSRLLNSGITEAELTDAKVNMKNNLIYGIDRKASRANNMAFYEYLGEGPRFILDQIALADQITMDEVNGFIKKRLTPDRTYTSIVGKK